jgi:hypothetical protein
MNREGKQIENPNASIIEVKTPEPAPEPKPKPTPKPEPEPENHGREGGNRGWGGGWNGNHQWNGVEGDGQLNLDGQDDPLYANPVPILLDSVVTLPVVKYEQVNGEMVEVTKYATFVQLDDDPRVEQDGYKPGQGPQPTRSAGFEGIVDEDYELGLSSIDADISHASLIGTIHHGKEIYENAVPLNHLPFDPVPLNGHNALVSNLVSLVQEEDAASSNIINFEAFDDLGDIIGEDPFVNALHGDVESIVMEEMPHSEIVRVANTVVKDEVREIPVMVMNLNNTTNVDLNVRGKTYRVIPQFSEKTMEQAKALCIENGASMMSSVQSADYSELTMKLKGAELDNIVIGSWNGNDYLASGSHCLVMQVGMGVFPSECVSASAVMCQK